MISEAYEYFGCNTADLFVMSVNTGNTNAECIQFDLTYGIEFPCISGVEGGGTVINSTYGIGAYPTYILIAPDHSIVEQDIWPVSSAQTFITTFESHGLMESECGGTLTAAFSSDVTDICQEDEVAFSDQSSGTITSWNWTFEGGDPATSAEQNPVVVYNGTGTFDVTLEISDGTNTSSLMLEDYIDVMSIPPVMLLPFDDACLNWPPYELTGGSPAGGDYSGPGVVDNWFYPEQAGIGTHMITYTFTGMNGCDNSTEQSIYVDPCVGVNTPEHEGFALYPNPTEGAFTIEVEKQGQYTLQIHDVMGQLVYESEFYMDSNLQWQIDSQTFDNGLYFVSLKSENNNWIRKLRISN